MTKFELVEVAGKKVTNDARYHVNLLADYVTDASRENPERWITLKEAAHVMFHNGNPTNQQRINRKLSTLFNELKTRGLCLVVEQSSKSFKIYSGSDVERQYMLRKREFWGDRRDTSQDKEEFIADSLLGENDTAQSTP